MSQLREGLAHRQLAPATRGERRGPFGLPMRMLWMDGGKPDREGHCRACLRHKSVRPLTRHHVVPQEWWRRQRGLSGFRNARANIVPLCRDCHDMVERDEEARRMLRRVLTQEEVAFVVAVMGKGWLDRRYPK